jgi:hypothetical protein
MKLKELFHYEYNNIYISLYNNIFYILLILQLICKLMILQLSLITYIVGIIFNSTIDYLQDKYLFLSEYNKELIIEYNEHYFEYKYSAIKLALIISVIINIMQFINTINDKKINS